MPSRNPPAYGPQHKAARRRWATQLPVECHLCGNPVMPWQRWDLDHVIPVVNGGEAGEGVPTHATCNRRAGQRLAKANDRRRRNQTPTEIPKDEKVSSRTEIREFAKVGENPSGPVFFEGIAENPDRSVSVHTLTRLLPQDLEREVMELPWVKCLGEIPSDSCLPRVMSGPNREAFGSYGPDAIEWLRDYAGFSLFWWQQVFISRMLEYDVNGDLVWLQSILSTPRQSGKSFLVRALCLWRMHQTQYGGPQTVVSMATSLALAKEVQRGAHAWAEEKGYKVTRGEAYRSITGPDGGRWILLPAGGAQGYTNNLVVVDEAFGIPARHVEDRVEPTMLAADHPQMLLTSTAHPEATTLMRDRRRAAIRDLEDPNGTLLMEWSAPAELGDLADESAWRAASPWWTRQRAKILRQSLSADPLSFRAQYLNIWPTETAKDDDEILIDAATYAANTGMGPMGYNAPVIVLEDNFGHGQALAMAERDAEGFVHVTADFFDTREKAWDYIAATLNDGNVENPTLLLGATLDIDPGAETVDITPSLRGARETRAALALYRSLVRERRVIHDVTADDMRRCILAARTATTSTGVTLSHRHARVDIVRAVLWAIAEAAQPSAEPKVA